jgi:hypothetical protein
MPSQLLSLPPEIRNQVYELVFLDPGGLDYVKSGPASGKLCLHELRAEVKAGKGNVFGYTEAVSTSPTSSTPATHHGRTIANQLQNVCRQTRCETVGLEILYNHTITFTCPKAETFMLFMSSLPLNLQNHSHKFTLRAPIEGWTSDQFKGLPEFCRAFP